ncbi:EAL domain-containing protein [uncultured Agrobacterium sp.]|uniref:putative bifunctional diguanylate cyclase/phosphodiesterase n=1 Tax=uncultured Agrobacterium sp. TaxID=157277 RepID=UPI0025F924A5|nr:EAL domain-containing protein [uncultured Agrobacterium sp.]
MTSVTFDASVKRDQLVTLRKMVALSIPINIVLGLCALVVATYYGNGRAGAIWFLLSTVANAARLVASKFPLPTMPSGDSAADLEASNKTTQNYLRLHIVLALASGLVWAWVPVLCDWYTSPQTLFYALIVCGLTAGAVTYGYSFANVPTAFITPPLVTSAYWLEQSGGLDKLLISITVGLYLFALIRGARVNERLFCNDSRKRNEAIALSGQLEKTTNQALMLARNASELMGIDKLTGLLNRHGFSDRAEPIFALQADNVMFMLDLDGFKSINDAFGHQAGDRVLMEAAKRIEEVIGQHGFAARLGGDEFSIVLTQPCSDSSFRFLAKTLISAVSRPYPGIEPLTLGVSIGVYYGSGAALDDALMCSDIALYAAKKDGRNQFRIFDVDLRDEIERRRDIEMGLIDALSQQNLEVWYQPIVRSDTQQIESLEALLRWHHPRLGGISPPKIVSAASSIGRSGELLKYIFMDVATTLSALGESDVMIAINISPRELARNDVEALITECFSADGIALSRIELEITEDATIDQENVKLRLNSLSEKNVRLAIDDFGTGYSSLATLQQLQITRLKIDKSFVTGTRAGSTNSSLIEAMVKFSDALGFEVVAEGVETKEDLHMVKSLGCAFAQGYYFSKAIPRTEVLAMIEQRNQSSSKISGN